MENFLKGIKWQMYWGLFLNHNLMRNFRKHNEYEPHAPTCRCMYDVIALHKNTGCRLHTQIHKLNLMQAMSCIRGNMFDVKQFIVRVNDYTMWSHRIKWDVSIVLPPNLGSSYVVVRGLAPLREGVINILSLRSCKWGKGWLWVWKGPSTLASVVSSRCI